VADLEASHSAGNEICARIPDIALPTRATASLCENSPNRSNSGSSTPFSRKVETQTRDGGQHGKYLFPTMRAGTDRQEIGGPQHDKDKVPGGIELLV